MKQRRFWLTDMPVWLMLLLVALGLPRTVLEDLDIVAPESSLLYYVLALTPFAAWLAVAIFRPTRKPLMDFLVLGALYGLSLVIVHQALWTQQHDTDDGRGTSIMIAMVIGLGTGLLAALVAIVAAAVRKRRDRPLAASDVRGDLET